MCIKYNRIRIRISIRIRIRERIGNVESGGVDERRERRVVV